MAPLDFTVVGSLVIYSYFEKSYQKNVHATIPKGNMRYDQHTLFLTLTLVAFHGLSCHSFKLTRNHPQHLCGLSRILFPTTFLEIAVYSTAVVLRTYVSLYYSSPHILTVILVGNEQFIKMCMANAFS